MTCVLFSKWARFSVLKNETFFQNTGKVGGKWELCRCSAMRFGGSWFGFASVKIFVLFSGEYLANSTHDDFTGNRLHSSMMHLLAAKIPRPNIFAGFVEFCSVLLHLTISGLSCLFLER